MGMKKNAARSGIDLRIQDQVLAHDLGVAGQYMMNSSKAAMAAMGRTARPMRPKSPTASVMMMMDENGGVVSLDERAAWGRGSVKRDHLDEQMESN
jgi:hypothetical protein